MDINLGGLDKVNQEILGALREGEQEILQELQQPGDPGYNDFHVEANATPVFGRAAFIPHGVHQAALPPAQQSPSIEPPQVLQMIAGTATPANQKRIAAGRNDLFALNPWRDGPVPSGVAPNALANRNAYAMEAEQMGANNFGSRILGATVSSLNTQGGNNNMPGGQNALGQILLWLQRIYDVLGDIRNKIDGLGSGSGQGSGSQAPKNPSQPKPVDDGGMGWMGLAGGAALLAMGAYTAAGADGSGVIGNTAFQAIRSGKAGLNTIAQEQYDRWRKYGRAPHTVDDEGAFNKFFDFNPEKIGDSFHGLLNGARTFGERAKIWGGRGILGGLLAAGAIDVGTHAARAHTEFSRGDKWNGLADTREAAINGAELLTGMLVKNNFLATGLIDAEEVGKGGLKVWQDYASGHQDKVQGDIHDTMGNVVKTTAMGLVGGALSKMFFRSKFGKPVSNLAGRGMNALKNLVRRPGATASEAAGEGEEAIYERLASGTPWEAGAAEAGGAEAAGGAGAAATGGALAFLGPVLAAAGISVAGFSLLGKAVHVDRMQRINEFAKMTSGGMDEKKAAQMLNDKYHLTGDDAFGYGAHAWKGPAVVHQAQQAAAAQQAQQQAAASGGGQNTVNVNLQNPVFKTPVDRDEVIHMIQQQINYSLQLFKNQDQHANGPTGFGPFGFQPAFTPPPSI